MLHPGYGEYQGIQMRLVRHLFFAIIYAALGSAVILVGGYTYMLDARPDLKVWHQTVLDAEYTTGNDEVIDFEDYLQLEDRLFDQLREQVYDRIDPADRRQVIRYSAGSMMDPASFPKNWNRTFELAPDEPVGGVLLLHGLSDSPYSLRSLCELLYQRGYHVVGLRIPGHGTAPSGLLDAQWEDWAAAVRIAATHVVEKAGPDQPLFVFGYSNGAALSVEYALASLEQDNLPVPDGLVLLSPAIGVSSVAAFASWQARLGRLIGLDKLAWNSIELEFDPYKYGSFAVNAGDQIYQLTGRIGRGLEALKNAGRIDEFPGVLAFMSVVDATVPPSILIRVLFDRLADQGHQLVLFDVDRRAETQALLAHDPHQRLEKLVGETNKTYDLTLVTNRYSDSRSVEALFRLAGDSDITHDPLQLEWPTGVFSLSHVALPFPPDDPLYGGPATEGKDYPWITLGNISIRGERNLLLFPDNYFLRLRYNPFHDYLTERVLGFMQ